MILSFNEIKDILLNNPAKKTLVEARNYASKMRRHLYGENLSSHIAKIDGYENKTLHDLRVKYIRNNKDIFSRLKRPVDKVFSAKGGSVYYNLPDSADKRARQLSSDIVKGYSIKQWNENYWKPHFIDDPNGIIFMEILPAQQVQLYRRINKSYVYPTYRSSEDIYDYFINGSNLEYVVFYVSKVEKKKAGFDEALIIYRVVDDSKDYWIKVDGEQITIIDDQTFPNYFMKVPGMLNSDIIDPNNDNIRLSLFDEVMELAEDFLITGSIKKTHSFQHGFPKYWEYADFCNTCKGTTFHEGETCKTCNGSGKAHMSKVSDVKLLDYPENKETPVVAPDVAGYISPDKSFWEMSNTDLQLLERLMHLTLWGSDSTPKTQGMSQDKEGQKTATEIVGELKPQADRLHAITEQAEKRHKFILDMAVQIQISQSYQGSTVNYGKRYMLESPDVIFEKYSKARKDGAAASVLDDLLIEYYESKYDSDPVKLAIQMKLMRVEPFIHKTAEQVKTLAPDENDYKTKLYFSEWVQTMNEAQLLVTDAVGLRELLAQYVSAKNLPQPEPKQIAA